MDTRAEPRFRRRMACELTRGKSIYSGFVLDVSRTGLFVQTGVANAQMGDEVEVTLRPRGPEPPIALKTQVVWQRRVPLQLRTIAEGGLGLHIRYAPEPYYRLLLEAARPVARLGGTA